MNLDLVALYAYSDRVHGKDRELWRRFISFLLPMLLELESTEIEKLLDSAMSRSPEDVLSQLDTHTSAESTVRFISAELAQALEVPPELGVASFLDANPPTRAHLVKSSSLKIKDETLVSRWLNTFTKAQHHEEFISHVSQWKSLMARFYDSGERVEPEALASEKELPRTA